MGGGENIILKKGNVYVYNDYISEMKTLKYIRDIFNKAGIQNSIIDINSYTERTITIPYNINNSYTIELREEYQGWTIQEIKHQKNGETLDVEQLEITLVMSQTENSKLILGEIYTTILTKNKKGTYLTTLN